ncbi:unnamed protein product [Merluccius merluccius]
MRNTSTPASDRNAKRQRDSRALKTKPSPFAPGGETASTLFCLKKKKVSGGGGKQKAFDTVQSTEVKLIRMLRTNGLPETLIGASYGRKVNSLRR